jgi:O-antigen ligase
MAVTTWTPGGYFSVSLFFWRFLAPPIIAIELLAIIIAWMGGFRPLATILAFPGWIAAAIGILVAIDMGDALFIAPSSSTAMMRSSMTLIHLLFGLGVFHLLRIRGFDDYRMLWWVLLGGSILYLGIMVAFLAAITRPDTFDWLHFGLGVVNIRHVGFYVVVGAAMALGIAATEARPRFYWLAVAAATLCCTELFWSGSRSPLFALLMASLVSAALVPTLRHARLPMALLIAYVGAAALSLLYAPPAANFGLLRMLASGSEKTADAMTSGRVDLWGGSFKALLASPVFGHGEGQFITVVPAAEGIFHHPHNMVLQALVQWGVVGTLIFVALAGVLWWGLFRGTRIAGARVVPAFLAVNAFAIYAMFDGVLFFVYPTMILAFLFATGLAAGKLDVVSRRMCVSDEGQPMAVK